MAPPGVLTPPRRPRGEVAPPDGGIALPPDFWDDGGGGGGGGDGGRPEPEDDGRRDAARRFAVRLVLMGIAALFLVFLAFALALRRDPAGWPPPGTPPAPRGLLLSTVLLALSCVTAPRAAAAAGARDRARLARWLEATGALGAGFVASQVWVWTRWSSAGLLPESHGYAMLFYALSGLHALHVLAGLAIFARLRWKARELAARGAGATVRLAGLYWHFMGLVWAAVLLVIWLPGAGAP